ncbi:AraC family transcriptional regulator [Pseudoalteromonas sp. SG41-2]|uniref:AraC family transcriptional regulator n=1 Tax=Pseudoalteromonas sp. SG41-2 TaxID=2760978 RepID=UPI001601D6EB|nr:AraC family transcriptional regulator [Pseudoalteromonas sp. SG41-2]MBB1480537.1 AraC family transcriptional regulator [Pseudoalteromonas sp. SG41-2]
MLPTTHPIFWRDPELPFVELRQVLDGRKVTYAPHSHQQWSIGAILAGQSEFICEDRLHQVTHGNLVLMNPDEVHACNPKQNSAWAYYMMHIDKNWLAALLFESGVTKQQNWQGSRLDTVLLPQLYQDFVILCQNLMTNTFTAAQKRTLLSSYFVQLFTYLDCVEPLHEQTLLPENKLYQIANYLNEHCFEDQSINTISTLFGFSSSYLVRAFKRHFNMTPHAYRLNRRIQLGQQALKQGQPIASIAHSAGFSDQAHFQRVFKQRVAATPEQYRRTLSL